MWTNKKWNHTYTPTTKKRKATRSGFMARDLDRLSKFIVQNLFSIIVTKTKKDREIERVEWLTAFCPSTVHKIPSDAFARHARIMYVGSIYFTSAWIAISLKYFLIWNTKVVRIKYLVKYNFLNEGMFRPLHYYVRKKKKNPEVN